MPRQLGTRWRPIPSWLADALLAAIGIAVAVVALTIVDELASRRAVIALAVVGCVCACSAFARRSPLVAALTAAPVILLGVPLRNSAIFQTATDGLVIPLFLFAYHLGAKVPVRRSLVAIVVLAACCQAVSDTVNPFILVDTVGPWIVGFIARSRAQATHELSKQGLELERAQARYDEESIRYERTRIARELHDIVAHCVTVVVVQADAARYLPGHDAQRARDALDTIRESARAAEVEIARLVAVLAEPSELVPTTIDDLVNRTRATGLPISYELVGDVDRLPPQTLDTAYRIVRESVTNALKHAPGARVDIVVRCTDSVVQLQVSNAAPQASGLDLTDAGGGHGLAGIRERVAACGGNLHIGPTDGGGWRVAARLPAGVRASL